MKRKIDKKLFQWLNHCAVPRDAHVIITESISRNACDVTQNELDPCSTAILQKKSFKVNN